MVVGSYVQHCAIFTSFSQSDELDQVSLPSLVAFPAVANCRTCCGLPHVSRSIALSTPMAPSGDSNDSDPSSTMRSATLSFAGVALPEAVASTADRITVFCGTWNMAEQSAPVNIRDWIPLDRDIYAIGLQECMEAKALRRASLVAFSFVHGVCVVRSLSCCLLLLSISSYSQPAGARVYRNSPSHRPNYDGIGIPRPHRVGRFCQGMAGASRHL